MDTSTTPINEFIKQISEINDTDYGDFMRKANHALLTLKEKIYDQSTLHVKELLNELQHTIQFYPNWDLESTKLKTSMLAELIKQNQIFHFFGNINTEKKNVRELH